MAVDHIRYDLLAQDALRGMVRTVLTDAAKKGLPGEHHFFISFDTRADGVRISPRLREQYPDEMTIVLQHQFWDLKVGDDSFEVGLSFNGIAERLTIPFTALKSFVDPSAQFALQFEEIAETANDAGVPPAKSKIEAKFENKSENRNEKSAGKPRRQSRQESARQEPARQESTRAAATRTVPSIPQQPALPAKPAPAAPASKSAAPPGDVPDKPDKPSRGADVVRLDKFRKK